MPPKVEETVSVTDHFGMLHLGLLDTVSEPEESKLYGE